MALYVVVAVRFDENGEVECVRWARADGAANQFEEQFHVVQLDRVIEAFDRGDTVETTFDTLHGTVSGGRLVRKILPGGVEAVRDDVFMEGRALKDLPRF